MATMRVRAYHPRGHGYSTPTWASYVVRRCRDFQAVEVDHEQRVVWCPVGVADRDVEQFVRDGLRNLPADKVPCGVWLCRHCGWQTTSEHIAKHLLTHGVDLLRADYGLIHMPEHAVLGTGRNDDGDVEAEQPDTQRVL